MSPRNILEHTKFPMPCPNPECGKEVFETVSWYKSKSSATCPHCGSVIDLTNEENSAMIEKFVEALSGIGADYANFSKD